MCFVKKKKKIGHEPCLVLGKRNHNTTGARGVLCCNDKLSSMSFFLRLSHVLQWLAVGPYFLSLQSSHLQSSLRIAICMWPMCGFEFGVIWGFATGVAIVYSFPNMVCAGSHEQSHMISGVLLENSRSHAHYSPSIEWQAFSCGSRQCHAPLAHDCTTSPAVTPKTADIYVLLADMPTTDMSMV